MTRSLRGNESIVNLKVPDLFRLPAEFFEGGEITSSTTLTRAHLGRLLVANSGSAIALTVPADTSGTGFIDGEPFYAIMYGAGQLSFAAANGVTIRTPSGLNALAQYAVIGLIRMPTANEWLAVGNLTS